MKRVVATLTIAAAACLPAGPVAAQAFDASADPVFKKMVSVNAGLKSYTAHIDVKTAILFGSFTLHGTLYERGNRSAIVFDNVPAIAKSAVDDVPSIAGPSAWAQSYAISLAARTAEESTFHLVPLEAGEVSAIDAVVSNDSGLVREYTWTETSGATITSDQTYESVDGYQVVASTATKTGGRGMHTTSHATFTNYAINVDVPANVLATAP